MATKKKPAPKAKPPTKKPIPAKRTISPRGSSTELPARFSPQLVDDALEEDLLDVSGVFRVTTDISKAQTRAADQDEGEMLRFNDPSMVMRAIKDEDL